MKISEIQKKITDHDHDKYITTLEFNKSAGFISGRLAQASLANRNDISSFVKKRDFDNKQKDIRSNNNNNSNNNINNNNNQLKVLSKKVKVI